MVVAWNIGYLLPVFLTFNRTWDFSNWSYNNEPIYNSTINDTAAGRDTRANFTAWKYGAERIYDVRIDGTAPGIRERKKIFVYNTTMKLKCQYSYPTINCHFHNPRIVISLIESDGKHRVINESKPINDQYPTTSDHYFEFDIDPYHDDSKVYTASSSITPARLDVARSLIDTLRTPDYFYSFHDGDELNTWENSTVGTRCKSRYVVARKKFIDDSVTKEKTNSYEILIYANETIPMNQSMEIRRTRLRNIDTCTALITNTYGTKIRAYPQSSTSHIIIRRHNFTCVTESEAILSDVVASNGTEILTGNIVNMRETITLRLEDVIPAAGPAPTIDDPKTFGVTGTQIFHSYSAQQYLLPNSEMY